MATPFRGHAELFGLLGPLVIVLSASLPSPAHADGVQVEPTTDPAPPPVPRECKPRYMAGPAVGVALFPDTTLIGAALISRGADPHTRGDRAAIVGGTLLISAAVATLVLSAVKLKRNRDSRRRVCGLKTSW